MLLVDVNRVLTRHRRITALVGVIVVFGVVALNAHAALPEHHHDHGEATMCVAALSIAVLAALCCCAKRAVGPGIRLSWAPVPRALGRLTVSVPWVHARAGPPAPVVLRL